jgi:hypothetical protein
MKKVIVIFVLIFLYSLGINATKNKLHYHVGNKIIKNQSELHNYNYVALVGQQFDGEIPRKEFLKLTKLDLFPSSQARITSYNARFYHEGKHITLSIKGENFNGELIGYINEMCAAESNSEFQPQIFFYDIQAQIEDELVQLNSIRIIIAPQKSNRKIVKNFCYSNWEINERSISINKVSEVSAPQGTFNGELLPLHSCTLEYTKAARTTIIKIRNEQDFENFTSEYKPFAHDFIRITNALYKFENKLIRGTQLILEFND